VIAPGFDEPYLVAALLTGQPPLSRNRNFELLSSDVGRRARRRASFLRSVARDIERMRVEKGTVSVEHGSFARGAVRVVIRGREYVRSAYLTHDEVQLMVTAFPRVARVLDLHRAS